jgi:hypothetical protein
VHPRIARPDPVGQPKPNRELSHWRRFLTLMAVQNDQRPVAAPVIEGRDPFKAGAGEAQLAKVDDETRLEF